MRDIASRIGAFLGRVRAKIDQSMCRHDHHYAFAKERTFLRCHKCGHETHGWDMAGAKPPTQRFAGDPKRHRLN